MGFILDRLQKLTRQLLPTGRAFSMPSGGYFETLTTALNKSLERAWNDAVSIKDAQLPDNANFTTDDATKWEGRLGLITNNAVPLSDRKMAIELKMNHPGTIKARQNWRYLQKQLQSAGFNVYVYENRFPLYPSGYETQDPLTLSGGIGGSLNQHGDFQHGDAEHGSGYNLKVVNSIDPDIDSSFDVGNSLRWTIFIGGNPVGTFANVDAAREKEFRQLILQKKPVEVVAFLFINFV